MGQGISRGEGGMDRLWSARHDRVRVRVWTARYGRLA